MNRKRPGSSLIIAIGMLLWSGVTLSIFYIVQRPVLFQVIRPVGRTLWSILLLVMMLVVSAGVGCTLLRQVIPATEARERLLLGTGMGLGLIGFAGYGLAAFGLAKPEILILLLFTLLAWTFFGGSWKTIRTGLSSTANIFRAHESGGPQWMKYAAGAMAALSFLFALLPPAEGFDGLLYHLALPERMLHDGGLQAYNILPFWFPSLMEGDFVWALGLGSERTAQLMHWSFMLLTLGLVWEWSRRAFGERSAAWSLLMIASMPSLPWVAGWAYTDLALSFAGLACLYALWRWPDIYEDRWLLIGGYFAGMAMGIKYTSFLLPLVCLLLILAWAYGRRHRLAAVIKFSCSALLVAAPWYMRNWLVMGNPFYPFVFDGRYWDSFQSTWYAGAGTGISLNLGELLLLPINIMAGLHDQNFFDGRTGPLFLLFFPIAAWAAWRGRHRAQVEQRALCITWIFGTISLLIWTLGVMQSSHLWQTRLLWPAMIPFAIPMGAALAGLPKLDLPRLRLSFVLTALCALVIAATLVDNALSLALRRPLGYSLGLESREAYFERIQPGYSAALELVESTAPGSQVYFLFEPRSYGMSRPVQADPINNNLLHDFYLYRRAGEVIGTWQHEGYTHILIYTPGLQPAFEDEFEQVREMLHLEAEKEGYQLYSIPSLEKAEPSLYQSYDSGG